MKSIADVVAHSLMRIAPHASQDLIKASRAMQEALGTPKNAPEVLACLVGSFSDAMRKRFDSMLQEIDNAKKVELDHNLS